MIPCMDLVGVARSLVTEHFPRARAAFLGGSVAAGRATSTSDLDIVILVGGRPAPYRETIRVDSMPVELFVHTEQSLPHWSDRDRRQGHCALAHMIAFGCITPWHGGHAESKLPLAGLPWRPGHCQDGYAPKQVFTTDRRRARRHYPDE
jgi:hypothetical protein